MPRDNYLTSVGALFVFIGLFIMAIAGIAYSTLVLGIIITFVSAWTLLNSPRIWRDYQASYKKLPKKKRNIFNQPKQAYYLINRYLLMPYGIALGSLLIYLSWLTQ